jgi:glycosyltransferase involved in cell wall biosynthesis
MQFGRAYAQGTERYVGLLSQELRGRGHEVIILAGDPLGHDRPRRPGESISKDPALHAWPTRGPLAVFGSPVEVAHTWLRRFRPDVVHVANPAHVGVGMLVAAIDAGIPTVATIMDYWWVCPKATLLRPGGAICDGRPDWRDCVRCMVSEHDRPRARLLADLPRSLGFVPLALYLSRAIPRGMTAADMSRWPRRRSLLTALLNRVDQVVFPSAATRDAILGHLRHDRWRVVPYGLEPHWFEHDITSRINPGDTLTIGYAGTILPHKGPDLLIRAVRQLNPSDMCVRIAGPAPDAAYRRELERMAEGLPVEFIGPVAPDCMPDFMRSLDVLVVPSRWPENLPLVVLEAQASGIPVVGANVGGIAPQIPDRRCTFAPGSAEELAACIEYVREHRRNIRPARVHTAGEMAASTEMVYREVCSRNEGQSRSSWDAR